MRVFALIVTRNECDRYLQACLEWHIPIFDAVMVYDDQSTDRTKSITIEAGSSYTCRPDSVPTFMEHEGQFRQDSLMALEELWDLQPGDWVMGVDTDEFLVAERSTRQAILDSITQAEMTRCKSVMIPRPELWSLTPPAERVDGFWGGIRCTRLFRFEPGGAIRDVPMGCGNEPTYINSAPICHNSFGLHLLHVGYVDAADREEKFQRYSTLADHGHNKDHINSILGKPRLREWEGTLPPIWRGLRGES